MSQQVRVADILDIFSKSWSCLAQVTWTNVSNGAINEATIPDL